MLRKGDIYKQCEVAYDDAIELLEMLERLEPDQTEKINNIRYHLKLIELFQYKVEHEDLTTEELLSCYNIALSWGLRPN